MGGKRNIQKKPVVTCRRSLTVPGLQEEYRLVYACLDCRRQPPLYVVRAETPEKRSGLAPIFVIANLS